MATIQQELKPLPRETPDDDMDEMYEEEPRRRAWGAIASVILALALVFVGYQWNQAATRAEALGAQVSGLRAEAETQRLRAEDAQRQVDVIRSVSRRSRRRRTPSPSGSCALEKAGAPPRPRSPRSRRPRRPSRRRRWPPRPGPAEGHARWPASPRPRSADALAPAGVSRPGPDRARRAAARSAPSADGDAEVLRVAPPRPRPARARLESGAPHHRARRPSQPHQEEVGPRSADASGPRAANAAVSARRSVHTTCRVFSRCAASRIPGRRTAPAPAARR